MNDWLPLLNFVVQCGLLVGLIWYTCETYKIRKASQRSAQAAIDATKAAQENLRLLKESYEERLGQGIQIVFDAIQRAKSLIVYWKTQAAHIAQPPHANPDPAPLANSGLLDVLSHARQFSGCSTLLIQANAAMGNAKSELEKAYAMARKQTFTTTPGRAPDFLLQAEGLLERVAGTIFESIKQERDGLGAGEKPPIS
jgi:hypothetical protein